MLSRIVHNYYFHEIKVLCSFRLLFLVLYIYCIYFILFTILFIFVHNLFLTYRFYNNNNNNNNNNYYYYYYYYYLLQLGCNPVAVVMLHVYKT